MIAEIQPPVTEVDGMFMSLGPFLWLYIPGCVRVIGTRTLWLTEDHTVRYAWNHDKGNLFIKVTTILPLSGLVGDHPGPSPSQGDSAETGFQGKRPENRETVA